MNEKMMHIVKKDKKKLLLLSVLAIVSLLLLILGNSITSDSEPEGDTSAETVTVSATDTADELEQILSSMSGVGKVAVTIYYDGDIIESYAYNEERSETITEDGVTDITEKKELVLTDGDGAPVVTERQYPDALGVLVTAEGAYDDKVRKNLLDAVASYLNIGKNRIEITAMEVQ